MGNRSIYRSEAGAKAVAALYEATLARWPVPYEEIVVTTRHGDTHMITCGPAAAPPLVFLHGAGANSAMWVSDVAHYRDRNRVLLVDLPGEPGKSEARQLDWEGQDYAEWLGDVLDGLGMSRVMLLGLSQGAFAALKFAVSYPKRVSALVLLAPGGIVHDRLGFVLRALPLSLLGSWGARRICLLLAGKAPLPEDAEDAVTLMMTHCTPRIGALPLFSDVDLQMLTMPVQLIVGAHDVLRDGRKIARRLEHLLPSLKVTVLPTAGHVLVGTGPFVVPFLTAGGSSSTHTRMAGPC